MSYNEDISHISTLDLPWSKLRGCNILITGATGLIGGSLVDALMLKPGKDYAIYASGRNETRAKARFARFADDPDFHFIKYDVIEPLHSDVNFDYIIHAASFASPNAFSADPVGIMKANFYGTANLLDYGLNHNMKRFLLISTGEIYGNGDVRKWKETDSGSIDTMMPRSCYPSAKRAAETLCASYTAQYGIDTVVARLCHTYGPKYTENDNRAFVQFLERARNGENIVLQSQGLQFRAWIYVDDCIDAVLTILLKGNRGEAYNVANENSCATILEFAQTLASISGQDVVFDCCHKEESLPHITKAIFDTKKLRSLGWSPKHSLREGLMETITYLK